MTYQYRPVSALNLIDMARDINQALLELSNTINTVDINVLPVLAVEPQHVFEGMLCVCDGTNWNPLADGIKRAVIYLDGSWKGVS